MARKGPRKIVTHNAGHPKGGHRLRVVGKGASRGGRKS
jgi:hypothetical protein